MPDPAESGEPGTLERLRDRLIEAFGFQSEQSVRVEVETILKGADAYSAFTPSERFMLLNILRFSELRVEDTMVPRASIVAIEETAPLAELLMTFQEAGHSRLPVYRETLDDPRGMVHIKDLVAWMTKQARRRKPRNGASNGAADATGQGNGKSAPAFALGNVDLTRTLTSAKIVREVLYVPPSMLAVDLLLKMQTTRVHMAVVIDEYGGTDGLVSIEDLVEEIVGNIEDEHDVHEGPLIEADGEQAFIADARAPIEELESLVGVPLMPDERDEDIDTLGGLVFSLVGRIPVRGEIIRHPGGLEFEVRDSDSRRIKSLRVVLAEPKPAAAPDGVAPADDDSA